MCVPGFSTAFETFLILRRTERDMVKNVYWSSCKIPGIVVRFNETFNFLDTLSKNTQIPNFMKIRPVEAEVSHADGQTLR